MENYNKILIAEDQVQNIAILKKVLIPQNYQLMIANNGREALELLAKEIPDLILLDIMMPEMDGFETIQNIAKIPGTENVPIIFLTSQTEPENITRGFELGAVDYIYKPFNARELLARIKTHMENARLRNHLEKEVEKRSGEIIEMHKELSIAYREIIIRLGLAAEYRDNETGLHIQRIGLFAAFLAEKLGRDQAKTRVLKTAAMMHDVGKIGIPDEILLKPGKLTPEEFDLMKKHTTIGFHLLDNIHSDLTKESAQIALTHHEKWNGTGYPHGLSGNDIPLGGRLTALVDVFDALTSHRPYKEPWPVEKAVQLIRDESGKHFDPEIVDIFLINLDGILEIKNRKIEETGLAEIFGKNI